MATAPSPALFRHPVTYFRRHPLARWIGIGTGILSIGSMAAAVWRWMHHR